MAIATRGSSAYRLETKDATVLNEQPKTEHRRAKQTKTAPKLQAFVALLAVCLVAFGMAYRFAVLTGLNTEVNALEKELTLIQGQNKQTELAIEQSYDLKTVEEIAVTRLGMSRPSKAQITYISMNSADFAEVIGAEEPSALMSRLASGVLAYLR